MLISTYRYIYFEKFTNLVHILSSTVSVFNSLDYLSGLNELRMIISKQNLECSCIKLVPNEIINNHNEFCLYPRFSAVPIKNGPQTFKIIFPMRTAGSL